VRCTYGEGEGVPTSTIRRGTCPRCNSRTIRHYVLGFPEIGSLVDATGDLPAWIELTGCVIDPGPSFDRECEDCGLRWTSWSGARAVVSTWRELRDRLGLASNSEANDWLGQLLASTVVASFPTLDDPQGSIVVRAGTARRSLRFPFRYAEWESTLIDLFAESSDRLRDGLGEGVNTTTLRGT
jgi:hypothetical protein